MLKSEPFPSPLGGQYPPAGRYEGAVLGLGELGPGIVRAHLFGSKGDNMLRIDGLCTSLYPGVKDKKAVGLMKAAIVSRRRYPLQHVLLILRSLHS